MWNSTSLWFTEELLDYIACCGIISFPLKKCALLSSPPPYSTFTSLVNSILRALTCCTYRCVPILLLLSPSLSPLFPLYSPLSFLCYLLPARWLYFFWSEINHYVKTLCSWYIMIYNDLECEVILIRIIAAKPLISYIILLIKYTFSYSSIQDKSEMFLFALL